MTTTMTVSSHGTLKSEIFLDKRDNAEYIFTIVSKQIYKRFSSTAMCALPDVFRLIVIKNNRLIYYIYL